MKLIKKNTSEYLDEVEKLVEAMAYKLVDYSLERTKFGWQANVIIFAKNGTGIEDCAKVHKPLQQRLEVLLNTQELSMEVSSPGVRRVLKKTYEFKAFIGEQVSVWDETCTDWRSGKLVDYNDTGIVLETKDGKIDIKFEACKKAKLM